MTTTTTPTPVPPRTLAEALLDAIREKPTEAVNWLALADWMEETHPGRHLACLACMGKGLVPISEPPGWSVKCRDCRGQGRTWHVNEDIARLREVPGLLVAQPYVTNDGRHFLWTKEENDYHRGKPYALPLWLYELIKPVHSSDAYYGWWSGDGDGEKAVKMLHAAAVAFATAAVGRMQDAGRDTP